MPYIAHDLEHGARDPQEGPGTQYVVRNADDDARDPQIPAFSAVTNATPDAEAEAQRQGVEAVPRTPAFDVQPTLDLPQPGPAPAMPAWLTTLDAQAPTDAEQALNGLLLAMADDEFILGYRNSEWTGIAPMLEEDVAFSSMAQDEIGHARLFYTLLAERVGESADQIAYGRPPAGFRNAQFLELPRTNWAWTLLRQYLYDQYDQLRLAALAGSQFTSLADVVSKIQREEKYHAMHGATWMRRMAEHTAEARARLEAVLPLAWAAAGSLFEPLPSEDALIAAGYLATGHRDLQAAWQDQVGAFFRDLGLVVPAVAPTHAGGRQGAHAPDFAALWDELTIVYRIDPAARW